MKLVKVLAFCAFTMAVVVAFATVIGPDTMRQAELVWPIGNAPSL
ncbi:hypothetical protein [Tumebacillus avium]|nr:hypothetical protein [Tumebacillus avium]